MKQLLFLLLFPCLAMAQYQGNGNQKITLGEQTSADGLVYRGVASADTIRKPSIDTMAFILLDTNTNIIWQYKKAVNNAWTRLNLRQSDTTSFNYVNTYGTQTVNGAKTFTSAVTGARFNPTSSDTTGTGVYLQGANAIGISTNSQKRLTINSSGVLKYGDAINNPETTWNELPGVWAIGGTFPNVRFYASTTGGSYGFTSFQARNSATSTPLEFLSAYNLFQGRTGIGFFRTGDTTAWLTLAAGGTTIAPLKLKTSGAALLNPVQAGAIEFNGTNLLFTPTTTRHTVNHGLTGSATLDFSSTNAQNSRDMTITVTGAAEGDVVSLGVPNAAVNDNTCYTAWVSAANTVTVRFNNYSSGTVDPASGLFKVFVTK